MKKLEERFMDLYKAQTDKISVTLQTLFFWLQVIKYLIIYLE